MPPAAPTYRDGARRISRPGRRPVFRGLCPAGVRKTSAISNKKCSRKARTGGRCPVMGLLLSGAKPAPPPRTAGVPEFLLQAVRPFLLPLQLLAECGLRDRLKLPLSLQPPKLALQVLQPCPEAFGFLGGFWRLLRGFWRTVSHGSGDRMRRDPPTPGGGVACALEVAPLQAPADGPLRGPEDTGGLLNGVALLGFPIHTGILPLERCFAPLEAILARPWCTDVSRVDARGVSKKASGPCGRPAG